MMHPRIIFRIVGLAAAFAVAGAAAAQSPHAPLDGPREVTEDFKMTGADADSVASVGWSVGTAGIGANAFIVAGAFRDATFGPETGAAYVFRYNGTGWVEEQKLLAADAHANDSFGHASGAYSGPEGDFVITGAPKWPAFGRLGAAYVFRYDVVGSTWVEEDRLTVPNAEQDDALGVSVAMNGSIAIVSAPGENGIGGVYAFRRESDGQGGHLWIEEYRLIASDAQVKDGFGRRVALTISSVDTLAAVGTSGNITPGGAAYVFRRETDMTGEVGWVEEQKLVASDSEEFDNLGWAVAIAETTHGTFALVGAPGDDVPETNRGSAYVFRREVTTEGAHEWIQEAKLLASDGAVADSYGWSVSLTETTTQGVLAIVTTRSDDIFEGAAYAYIRQSTGIWVETAKMIASDGESGDFLGYASAVSDNWVVLGAPLDDPMGGPAGRGAVYTYDINRILVSTTGSAPPVKQGSMQVSPNPSYGNVRISYNLDNHTTVELVVFDLLGREVVRLDHLIRPVGPHIETLDLTDLPSGRYVLRLTTPSRYYTKLITKASSTF